MTRMFVFRERQCLLVGGMGWFHPQLQLFEFVILLPDGSKTNIVF